MDLIPAGWSRKHWFAEVRPCLPIATTTWRWTGVDLVLTRWLRSPGPAAVYRDAMAYYIFNVIEGGAAQATRLLRSSTWAIGPQEPHRDPLRRGVLNGLATGRPLFTGSSLRRTTCAASRPSRGTHTSSRPV